MLHQTSWYCEIHVCEIKAVCLRWRKWKIHWNTLPCCCMKNNFPPQIISLWFTVIIGDGPLCIPSPVESVYDALHVPASSAPLLSCYFWGSQFFFFLRVVSLEKWINSTHAKYFKVKPINRQTRVFTVLPTNWWRISMLQQWINRQQKQSSLIPQHPVDPFQQNSPNQEMKGHQTAMFYVICP